MRTKEPYSYRTLGKEHGVSHTTILRHKHFQEAIDRICENIDTNFQQFLITLQISYPKIPNKDMILISKIPAEQIRECFENILPECINAKQIIKFYISKNKMAIIKFNARD